MGRTPCTSRVACENKNGAWASDHTSAYGLDERLVYHNVLEAMSRLKPILSSTLGWTLLLAFLLSTMASSLHSHIGVQPDDTTWEASEISTEFLVAEPSQCSFCQTSRRLDSETQAGESAHWSPSLALLCFSWNSQHDATDSGLLSSSRSRAPPAQA